MFAGNCITGSEYTTAVVSITVGVVVVVGIIGAVVFLLLKKKSKGMMYDKK